MRLTNVTPYCFALSNRYTFCNHVSLFITGVSPQTPNAVRHILQNQKYYGIYVVKIPEGNLRNPFGVRRAPSEPVSVISVVKIPRQNLTSQTIIKRRIYLIFYHFSPMGTVPQAILLNLIWSLSALPPFDHVAKFKPDVRFIRHGGFRRLEHLV